MDSSDTTSKPVSADLLSIGITIHDLCTRCGTCVGVCPTQAIELDDNRYPRLIEEKCTACGLCGDTCPGGKVDYGKLEEITFGGHQNLDSFDGSIRKTYVGFCTDETIRGGGAGGGIVTALCWDLLKHGDVDGCIVTRMNREQPWRGEPFIARSYEDLVASQGSKYQIIPTNQIFQDVRNLPGRFAYVALPCQVHGYRMAAERDSVLRDKIHCVIGLFCGGSLEPSMVTELLKARGIPLEEIADFQFRGGEWPGQMRAILNSGEIRDLHYSNYKDGAYNYFTSLYMPARCQTCLDGSGQFADISISDAWTRNEHGEYRFKAHSRLLARTAIGEQVMMKAIGRGTIEAHDVTDDPDYQTHKIQTRRKGLNAPLRTERRLRAGKPAPVYDLPVPTASTGERLAERGASFILWLGRFYWFRYPVMKFLTSATAIPLIKFRIWRKQRKYARSTTTATR